MIHKPYLHLYWSKDPVFGTPIFSQLMRRDRFEQIRKMIHFTNPLLADPTQNLSKLDTYLNALRERYKSIYIPERDIAVDEYLSLWKGRLRFKIYIPSKRERYGVKIYMLCESATGYLRDFIVYTGADTIYPEPPHQLPKPFEQYKSPSKVVLALLAGLFNKGYSLALDNLYTAPELLKALWSLLTDAYGTLRKKEGLPPDFWSWKPVKGVGEPGIVKFCEEKYMTMRWNDPYKTKSNKVVSLMSTRHTGAVIDSGKIHHSTDRPILKPDVIVSYNKSMGGVDNLSRVIVPYTLARKGVKWYRKIAEVFLDFTVYNAFIVYKKLNPGKKTTHLQFRQEIINQIITFFVCRSQSNNRGRGFAFTPHLNPLRLKGKHFLKPIPTMPGKTVKRRKCIRCTAMGKRKDTSYECRKCNVSLCLDPCFEIYHTKRHYDREEKDLSEGEDEDEADVEMDFE